MKTIIVKTLAPVGNSINHPPLARRLFLIPFMLLCSALGAIAQAGEPAALDTALPGGNTADGQNALLSLTTRTFNTAIGFSIHSFSTAIPASTPVLEREPSF